MKRRVYLFIVALLSIVPFQLANAPQASAQSVIQIGWVLDQHGSTACYRQANHVWCDSYPYGNPNINARTVDDWVHPSCPISSIQLISGSTGGNPALLYYPSSCYPYSAASPGYSSSFNICSGTSGPLASRCQGIASRPGGPYGWTYVDGCNAWYPDYCGTSWTKTWIYGV